MKPSIPKGTRDFLPQQVQRRNYIFDIIRKVFVRYGFQPIETPALENLSTLTGKYGEEGDKLLFKVLNNGDFLAKANAKALEDKNSQALVSSIAKRGLRYDLTVPFARFVVMNQNDLPFPFKRYQIQPVWRADRPQKGRYQEFYQCDVDVVGSDSLMFEAELVQIYDQVFKELTLPVEIKVNNRKVLAGIAEAAGVSDQFMAMVVAIDKLDKIGLDGVKRELEKAEIKAESIDLITQILEVKTLSDLEPYFASSETGQKGIAELRTFHQYFDLYEPTNEVVFDITLARGLSYYTGCIFEVKAKGVEIGSIGGGGRYDDLTGVFGMKGSSGVGVSFGAERIYLAMEELGLFPDSTENDLQLLLIAFDQETHLHAFKLLQEVRSAGVNAELYPEPTKLKKQMKYANARQAPYVILIGSDEMSTGQLSLKNMATGEQEKMDLQGVIAHFS